MRIGKRTLRRIWPVGVGLALIVAATAAAAAFAGSTGKSKAGKQNVDTETLIVAVSSDIQNLDPTLSSADVATQELLTNVYDWLIDYKVVNRGGVPYGSPNEFVGAIAQSFSYNKNRTVVTFHLRKGVKFANGDPIDAAAVKYTYDRIFKQAGVTAALTSMAAVKDNNAVKVVNPTTVRFDLTKANTLLFGNMAQFGHSILNPKVVKPHDDGEGSLRPRLAQHQHDGTEQGPFLLDSWERGNQWVLNANPNYYGQKPKVEQDHLQGDPERVEPARAAAEGRRRHRLRPAAEGHQGAARATRTSKSSATRAASSSSSGMNSKVQPLNNMKVRQAISYAVPYKTILYEVLQGYGRQLTSPIPFGTPTHTDEFFVYDTNIEKAKQLLKEAGYPNGFDTRSHVASGVEEGKETAVWVQQSLAQIGINVSIQELPGANFTSTLQKHELGFFFFNNWISINNDPFYHLYWLFRSDCCNYTNYANKKVWNAIDSNLLSDNASKRAAAADSVQKTIMSDVAVGLPVPARLRARDAVERERLRLLLDRSLHAVQVPL